MGAGNSPARSGLLHRPDAFVVESCFDDLMIHPKSRAYLLRNKLTCPLHSEIVGRPARAPPVVGTHHHRNISNSPPPRQPLTACPPHAAFSAHARAKHLATRSRLVYGATLVLVKMIPTKVLHFLRGDLTRKTMLFVLVPLILASHFGILVVAVWLYPKSYDWRYTSISQLLYPRNNPEFHAIASVSVALSGVLMLPFAGYIRRRLRGAAPTAATAGAALFFRRVSLPHLARLDHVRTRPREPPRFPNSMKHWRASP